MKYEYNNLKTIIINKKGNTSYGIGMCLLKITNSILNNEHRIMTISSYSENYDCYYSKPCVVGKRGIEKQLHIHLSDKDNAKLMDSITKLQDDKNLMKKLIK